MFLQLIVLVGRTILANAQLPPQVSFQHVLSSPFHPDIKISYNEPPPGTCDTVYPSQKQYTGYITLPPFTLAPIQQNYSINTFFWFVEARTSSDTAPLSLFMNGGPGSSSMIGLFQEMGPCEVISLADGSFGTQSRLWGWDRSSNMLFVDQPVQVGFSFDKLENYSYDLYHETFHPILEPRPAGFPSYLYQQGTFSSQDKDATANTTTIAANAVWHFLQGFLAAFPQYNPGTRPNSNETLPTGVNLWSESYGGIYGPIFADFFEEQNSLREQGKIPKEKSLDIELASVGIINGMVDQKVQMPFFPRFANNNSYGIQAIDVTTMLNALSDLRSSGGCDELITACRAAMQSEDPGGLGDNTSVNSVCRNAQDRCSAIQNAFISSGRSIYDIRTTNLTRFPSNAYSEYLNSGPMLQAIGGRVNYTDSSSATRRAFLQTGDMIRDGQIPALSTLLSRNIRVTLLYGDADYICNWHGGEAVSLAVAATIPSYSLLFPGSGYASVVINDTYVGGAVRQYGNLSFVRVYDAGHQMPAYQPETAFTLFTRAIRGTSIATGENIDLTNFRTLGPSSSDKRNNHDKNDGGDPICWIRALNETCTGDQIEKILKGKGVVFGGRWFENEKDYKPPASSLGAAKPGSPFTSVPLWASLSDGQTSITPTGVYTATATPTLSEGERTRVDGRVLVLVMGLAMICTMYVEG